MTKTKKQNQKMKASKKKVSKSQPPLPQKSLRLSFPPLSLKQKRNQLRKKMEDHLKDVDIKGVVVPATSMVKICEEVIPNNKVMTDGVYLMLRMREAGVKIVKEVFLKKHHHGTIEKYVKSMVESTKPLIHYKEMIDRRYKVWHRVRQTINIDTVLVDLIKKHKIDIKRDFVAECITYLCFVMYNSLCKRTGVSIIEKEVMKNIVKQQLAPPLLEHYYSICTPFFNKEERDAMIETFSSTMLESKRCAIELLKDEIDGLKKYERNTKDFLNMTEEFGFLPLPECLYDEELR